MTTKLGLALFWIASTSAFAAYSDFKLKISTDKNIVTPGEKLTLHVTLENSTGAASEIPAKGTCRFFSMFDILFSGYELEKEDNPCADKPETVTIKAGDSYKADFTVVSRTTLSQGQDLHWSSLHLLMKDGIRDLPDEKRKNIYNYSPFPVTSNGLDFHVTRSPEQGKRLQELDKKVNALNHCKTAADCHNTGTAVLHCSGTCCGCGYLIHKSEKAKFHALQKQAEKVGKVTACPCFEHCEGHCRMECFKGKCEGQVPPARPVY